MVLFRSRDYAISDYHYTAVGAFNHSGASHLEEDIKTIEKSLDANIMTWLKGLE